MNATQIKVSETKAVVSYFRGNSKFGRTTTLVETSTGKVLFIGMGVCTRKELYTSFVKGK